VVQRSDGGHRFAGGVAQEGGRAWKLALSSERTPRTSETASATRRSSTRSVTKREGVAAEPEPAPEAEPPRSSAASTTGTASPRMTERPLT
jgi:hypothetical protein